MKLAFCLSWWFNVHCVIGGSCLPMFNCFSIIIKRSVDFLAAFSVRSLCHYVTSQAVDMNMSMDALRVTIHIRLVVPSRHQRQSTWIHNYTLSTASHIQARSELWFWRGAEVDNVQEPKQLCDIYLGKIRKMVSYWQCLKKLVLFLVRRRQKIRFLRNFWRLKTKI